MAEKVKDGDFVQIDYVGRVKSTGRIFDLTKEAVAKKEDIYSEETKYGPVTVVIGAGHVLKGLENALTGFEVGQEKKVDIPLDAGFGEKDPALIKLVPRSVFKRERLNPVPGMPVEIQGQRGFVQTVSGGRIKVDFNHPLAGKELEYEVKVLKKITDTKEKISSLMQFHLPRADLKGLKIEVKNKEAEVQSPDDEKTRRFINLAKDIVATDILKYIKDLDKIKFVDVFAREKQTSQKVSSKTGNSK